MEAVKEIFGIWYLIGAALVFFMQAGFAMVESGFTRAKNAGNIIMKNLMDFCLGTFAFLIFGYSFLCGTDVARGVVGWIDISEGPLFNFIGTDWSTFVFNLVFCATAATIVSGAMAERTKFLSYCIYSFVISLFVYPIEAHWVWGPDGWLTAIGFHDFAGSAVIHYMGGLTALIGAYLVGPRLGKFNDDQTPNGIPGHSVPLGALGCFILWFGWYGFNGAAAQNGLQLSTIFATTTVAPAIATVTVMIITWLKYGKPDVAMCLNGSLAGLVAITAGCDAVNVFGSFVIGILAGITVCFIVWLLDYKLKIDDPVGAVAVHFGNGMLGTLAVGLFACGTDSLPDARGLFYGGGFHLLGVQALGLLCIGLWTIVLMTATFLLIKATVGLRVSNEEEILGLDSTEHGLESAYAGFAFESETFSYMTPYEQSETMSAEPVIAAEDHAPVIHPSTIHKVVIITKADRFGALKKAMTDIGVTGMTTTQVMGCGIQKGKTAYYRGAKVEMDLLPKLKAEIVVSSIPVDLVIQAAKKALFTGHMGDGKIFVYEVTDVVRISSGAHGANALRYE